MFCIQGNIGSGKSTVLNYLAADPVAQTLVNCVQEPVDLWSTYQMDGQNILEHFYKDPKRYAFPFQMMAFYTRHKLIKGVKADPERTIVMERSVETDKRIFAQLLIDDGSIDPLCARIYHEWFDDLTAGNTSHTVNNIYIRTPPEICYERISVRGRAGESAITMDYLHKCHELHEQWLLNDPHTHVIDGSQSTESVLNQVRLILNINGSDLSVLSFKL